MCCRSHRFLGSELTESRRAPTPSLIQQPHWAQPDPLPAASRPLHAVLFLGCCSLSSEGQAPFRPPAPVSVLPLCGSGGLGLSHEIPK